MQTGTITKRGRWWFLRFYETVLIDGNPVTRQKAVKLTDNPQYRTAGEVREAGLADPILAPANAVPESAQTLAVFLEHVYLPHVRETLKPTTLKNYTSRFKLLKPHLGNLELRKTRPSDIQRLIALVAASKPRPTSTLRHTKAFLSSAFSYAILKDLVLMNPVQAYRGVPEGLPAGETPAYTLEDTQAMLRVLDEPARTIVTVAALTGLRVGEIEGLRWEDISGDELRVSRAVWKGHIGTVKTRASRNAIPLLPIVREALEAHRKRSVSNEFIFSGVKSGRPLILENMLRREMIPALESAGITWRGWHGFRRGVATNLYEAGIDDLTISRILRHASVEVTRQSYIKRVESKSQRAMTKLAKAFRQAS